MSRGHSRRVVARRGRRSDQRRHRHGADPTGSGARPEPVPADQLDQLDQLAAVARQQQPTTAQPARRRGSPSGRDGTGNPAATPRQVVAERPRVDDGLPCACDGDRACLLHYGRR